MTTAQIESPFFISEDEALKIIEKNMEDIMGRLDASSGQSPNQSASGSTGVDVGSNPCPGPSPDPTEFDPNPTSCQCCLCA